ncbi:alpha/beta hydrolase [Reyranella sp. CPCC 100927]|uniref:alpha/beta hydrolase n=1 Tax=Reyranella sp. CPCC 100927 TaxID=2599616 RepID=UPI0011B747CB|nr:alpha/beta hydrolase [Reyranella sp. CPCC 100927]TWT13873.1 alpha/beta hydrolase [Reyranella sp. CPCC 100927]
MLSPRCFLFVLSLLLVSGQAAAQGEPGPHQRPVKVVAPERLAVPGGGVAPLYVSADWSQPLPQIERAVIVLHGRLRNADVYFQSALKAQTAAGEAGKAAVMIVPQFLAEGDVKAFGLPPDTLRWTWTSWQGGEPAVGPQPASSFAVLDAILGRLADRRLFPRLRQVVVAGHSGGGQVAQRYAVAAKGDAALTAAGVGVRYVVANPSSYAYFSAERPVPAIASACPGFNAWKYGMEALPPYLTASAPQALEKAYVARRVIYLLGTKDTDPNHPALDKSCMAEAQGPHRLARGEAYVATMRQRDSGAPHHNLWLVDGVGHNGDGMLTSTCGLAALFDVQSCPSAR